MGNKRLTLTETIVVPSLKCIECYTRWLRQLLRNFVASSLDAPGLHKSGAHVIEGQHLELIIGNNDSDTSSRTLVFKYYYWPAIDENCSHSRYAGFVKSISRFVICSKFYLHLSLLERNALSALPCQLFDTVFTFLLCHDIYCWLSIHAYSTRRGASKLIN